MASSPPADPKTPKTNQTPTKPLLNLSTNSTNSSATTKSPSPNNKRRNPASRRWKETLCHRYGDFRNRVLSLFPRDTRPNVTIVFLSLCILISFVILLCVGAQAPVEPMWITILVFGGTCSIGLTIMCLLSHWANRKFLSFLCSICGFTD
jgi:hypothetical protein